MSRERKRGKERERERGRERERAGEPMSPRYLSGKTQKSG